MLALLLSLSMSVAATDILAGPVIMDDGTPCWASTSAEEVGLALTALDDVTITSFDFYQNHSEGHHNKTVRLYDRDDVTPD